MSTKVVFLTSAMNSLVMAGSGSASAMNKEAYAFAGLIYRLGCFGLSRVGLALERSRSKGERH